MIPIISTVIIIVTMVIIRIRITIIRNTIVFAQINIKVILPIAELNIKLRSLKIILVQTMIMIIIILKIVVIIIIIMIIIIIIIRLIIKIAQDTSITHEIQCSYLGIVLPKTLVVTS